MADSGPRLLSPIPIAVDVIDMLITVPARAVRVLDQRKQRVDDGSVTAGFPMVFLINPTAAASSGCRRLNGRGPLGEEVSGSVYIECSKKQNLQTLNIRKI